MDKYINFLILEGRLYGIKQEIKKDPKTLQDKTSQLKISECSNCDSITYFIISKNPPYNYYCEKCKAYISIYPKEISLKLRLSKVFAPAKKIFKMFER